MVLSQPPLSASRLRRASLDAVLGFAWDSDVFTVSDVLEDLWELHPGVRDRVVTEIGEVRQHVNIFVGNEAIRWTGGLDTPVPEGAEISIIPAVSGG